MALLVAVVLASGQAQGQAVPSDSLLFQDDFELEPTGWIRSDPQFVSIVESGDEGHGRVLQLSAAGGYLAGVLKRIVSLPPAEPVYALIRGSESWGSYRLEGELYFPAEGDSYLGVIYHYRERGEGADFGSVYVIAKPDQSYIRVNPHYDWNPARALYEELRVDLEDSRIAVGRWIPFAAEVVGRTLHFYVEDLSTPRVAFSSFEEESGLAGLNPRIVGAPVWVDNLRVRSIDAHTYTGPSPSPPAVPLAENTVTRWEALGPFAEPRAELERGASLDGWEPFVADARGALVTARWLEHVSGRRFGYLRTRIRVAEPSLLEFSTAVRLSIWVDGERVRARGPGIGRFDFRRVAWFDFREGPRTWVAISAGQHEVLVRVESDYSGTGFFARLRPRPPG